MTDSDSSKGQLMLKRTDLYNYQSQAVDFAKNNPKCGLFLSLGAGKTIITLTTLSEIDYGTVLLIAPLRVAKTVWIKEAKNWEHTQKLEFNQLTALTPKKRLAQLVKGGGKINIANIDIFQWLLNNLYEWPFDTVIVDEFSMFKDQSTKRFTNAKSCFKLSSRIIGLTGTPAPNSLLNLWAQLFLLDEGDRLEDKYTAFRYKYFNRIENNPYAWALKPFAEEEIHKNISDIVISINAGDFIELPELVYNDVDVYLDKKERKLYEDMIRYEILLFRETNQVVTAANAAVLAGKLNQLASGTLYDEDGKVVNVHDRKVEALEDMVEELSGEPVLIAYKYVADLEKLKELYPDAPIMGKEKYNGFDDEELCDRWNDGEFTIMLISAGGASHGLNLQYGGHHIIEYTPNWSWEKTEQFYARLCRQNQSSPQVFVHRLLTYNSFDQRVLAMLKSKEKGQNRLIDAVKMVIKDENY